MLTNITFKKIATACMLLAMCSMMFMAVGCSDDKDNPVANNQDKIVTITTPDGEEYQISQAEIDKFTAESETYEAMIEAMDPYVNENQDGTYHFNADAFMATNPKMDELGNKVYSDLSKGIPVVNQMLLQERKQAGSTALSVSCHYYWWGKKCCYTGWQAYSVMAAFNLGAAVPGFNIILFGFGAWAGYLIDQYGGFCLNATWAGGAWLTSP